MKKTILMVAFFMNALLFGQSTTNLKVTESPEFKDNYSGATVLALWTTPTGNTGLVRYGKKEFLFDVFDKNLNLIHSESVERSKKETFYGYVSFDQEIKFISVESPSKHERIIYCNTFNIENKTITKKQLFTADVENGGLFSGTSKRKTTVVASPNNSYIAIATDNIKKNQNSYKVHVYDTKTLTLIYEKSYQEDSEKYYEPNDVFVDNEGIFYSLGKLFIDGKSQKKNGQPNYEFILNKISKQEAKSIKINLEDNNHIASLIINGTADKFNLLGFYSEEKAGRIKGGCTFEIDIKNLSVISKKKKELPKTVYEDMYSDAVAEHSNSKKKELKSYSIDYVLFDNNGNSYLLAEQFYVTQTYMSNGMYGAGTTITTYHYDNILVLKFDKNGDIAWGRSIFKKATEPSYNAFLKNEELHVILNSGKNLTEKSDGRTKVSKGIFESSSLYDINYSANGEVNYNKIQDNKNNNYYHPHYGTYNQGKFILLNFGKNKQFMILE